MLPVVIDRICEWVDLGGWVMCVVCVVCGVWVWVDVLGMCMGEDMGGRMCE